MNQFSNNQVVFSVLAVIVVVFLILRNQLGKMKVRKALEGDVLVIDVRSPSEYALGHYKDAVNIPHDQIAGKLNKIGALDRKIVVYCASGARSAAVEQTLHSKGYIHVTNAGSYSRMP